MRFLSRHRRHRFAGLAVLFVGLAIAGAVYYALAPKSAEAEDASSNSVENGRELFLVGCATCHGVNGQGVGTKDDTIYGPTLVGVGAAASDFQLSTGRMPMALTGPQAPVKPVEYTDEEIDDLNAFVASLGPGPAIPEEKWTDPKSSLSGEEYEQAVVEGGAFFRTNCTACHNSVGAGGALPSGRYAPALTDTTGQAIYEAMLTGPQQMPHFSDEVITPEDKRAIIAYIEEIRDEPNYGGVGGGGLGPVADGVWVWLIGIGSLVGFAVWIAAHGSRTKREPGA